jgi:hypothetical protein
MNADRIVFTACLIAGFLFCVIALSGNLPGAST